MTRSILVCTLLVACSAETAEPDQAEHAGQTAPGGHASFPPPEAGNGFQLAAKTVAPAGGETWACIVYDLPTEDWEMVTRVSSYQSDFMHHMSVMALSLTSVELEPGEYDCTKLYEQYPELMDGILIYGSQSPEQQIELPTGVAANLPPGIRLMHEMHYVNAGDEEVDVFSYVNAYTAPKEEIDNTIWGGTVRDLTLNIPAHAEHDEWTRCVMNADVDVLFISSHTHRLGTEVTVKPFDGENVGDTIYVNHDWHSPYVKPFTAAPIHVKAGTGFEFNCKFQNNLDRTVNYGLTADDEMCSMVLVFTPGNPATKCEPVASSDGLH